VSMHDQTKDDVVTGMIRLVCLLRVTVTRVPTDLGSSGMEEGGEFCWWSGKIACIIRWGNYCCNIVMGQTHVLFWTILLEFYCLSNAMHGQNINLPVCLCVCPSHFLSTRL